MNLIPNKKNISKGVFLVFIFVVLLGCTQHMVKPENVKKLGVGMPTELVREIIKVDPIGGIQSNSAKFNKTTYIDYFYFPDNGRKSLFVIAYDEYWELSFWGTTAELKLSEDELKSHAGRTVETRQCLRKMRNENKDLKLCRKYLKAPGVPWKTQ